uniref:Uncharacterized protein n=1 Tax=Candidatus Kentrum sp. TUN TaxID=2126343 RepID=A0A450ZE14_9GAMM|nr:MAG: hypothetical protein BECKTUN1418E_GA0071001_100436 [Candidatus Kentron sp. TUN]VFK51018.1 MAG: hypothetical protein BECKTUN1418D_GA0071000_100427 [Candidatus Kentron sp. TUN]VFK51997.1 MAG: hypothetical protein BECKTUN1418F_GA0071002_100436 [Candidatus Kentron sp. TUN]
MDRIYVVFPFFPKGYAAYRIPTVPISVLSSRFAHHGPEPEHNADPDTHQQIAMDCLNTKSVALFANPAGSPSMVPSLHGHHNLEQIHCQNYQPLIAQNLMVP